MQADTGTKMIHIGKNTKSTIVSKGISTDQSNNNYRGLVKIMPSADRARNYSQCDSMLVGNKCSANTFPYIEVRNNTAVLEHEASTSKINQEQIFYLGVSICKGPFPGSSTVFVKSSLKNCRWNLRWKP